MSSQMSIQTATGGEAAGGVRGLAHLPGRPPEERPAQLHLQAGERVREAGMVRSVSLLRMRGP